MLEGNFVQQHCLYYQRNVYYQKIYIEINFFEKLNKQTFQLLVRQ